MSARPFDFTDTVKKAAAQRQMKRCALCGKLVTKIPLTEQQKEDGQAKGHTTLEFHHVWPNQVGNAANKSHAWIRTELNCVMLCPDCHNESHKNGNTLSGPVLQPSEFQYSHGGDIKKHKEWVASLKQKIRR